MSQNALVLLVSDFYCLRYGARYTEASCLLKGSMHTPSKLPSLCTNRGLLSMPFTVSETSMGSLGD